ncbi:hypothetical protein CI102_12959 [Trichoderma harzianum]|nr:hypothetical protein CI102_12959 [Trichoderma harzianum]
MHRVQTLFTSVRHPDTTRMFTAKAMLRCPVSDLYVAFELCTRIDSALIHVAAATQQAISPEIHSTKSRPGALNAASIVNVCFDLDLDLALVPCRTRLVLPHYTIIEPGNQHEHGHCRHPLSIIISRASMINCQTWIQDTKWLHRIGLRKRQSFASLPKLKMTRDTNQIKQQNVPHRIPASVAAWQFIGPLSSDGPNNIMLPPATT